jgi:ATP-dependent DNA ligase
MALICEAWRCPTANGISIGFASQVETFPDGAVLFDYCSKFGFEGVVSKRKGSRYSSGPSRNWVSRSFN